MKKTDNNSVNTTSFINGLLIPFVGTRGMNRQIAIQAENSHRASGINAFAVGHMIAGVSLLALASVCLYSL